MVAAVPGAARPAGGRRRGGGRPGGGGARRGVGRAARGVDIVVPRGAVDGTLWCAEGWLQLTAAGDRAGVQPRLSGAALLGAAARRIPSGVVFDDPLAPDPALAGLAVPAHPLLFTFPGTLARHAAGLHYPGGGRVGTPDQAARPGRGRAGPGPRPGAVP